MMWKRYEVQNDLVAYVKFLNDNINNLDVNAEVVLTDRQGDKVVTLTKWDIRFREYFNGVDMEDTIAELKEGYKDRYGSEANDLTDLALYCADGWSRWSATETIVNPSMEQIDAFIKKYELVQSLK